MDGWRPSSVGSAPDALLAASRVIREQIAQAHSGAGQFPAYPRIVSPVSGDGWLATELGGQRTGRAIGGEPRDSGADRTGALRHWSVSRVSANRLTSFG